MIASSTERPQHGAATQVLALPIPRREPTGCVMSRLSASGPHRSSLWRRLRPRDNAATLLRGARACLALLAATALLALAAPAQAQTAVLISNFNQAVATGTNIPVVSTIQQMAQGFTTGSSPATLTSIDLKFYVAEATTELPSMTLHSGTPTGTEVASLTSSGSLAAGLITTITFNAPANTTLTLETTYFLVMENTGSVSILPVPTKSDAEESGGATGWSIADVLQYRPGAMGIFTGDFLDETVKSRAVLIRVNGTVGGTTNTAAMGAPTITGTAQVGQTLTAVTTGITDADGLTSPTYTYQWIRVNGTEADIASANSSTYTLLDADLGKTIKVKVSFTDDASNAETLTSAVTATVVAAATAPTVSTVAVTSAPASGDTYGTSEKIEFTVTFDQAVTVTGTPEFEFCLDTTSTVSCDVGSSPPARRRAALSSGSGTTALVFSYTVVVGDVDDNGIWIGDQTRTIKLGTGGAIEGTVGGLAAVLTHAEEGALTGHKVNGEAAANTPATGAPTITGTAQVGQTLTASTTGIADANGLTTPSYMYQWIRVDGTDEADLTDKTAATYTMNNVDLGKTLKVRASFTDDAGNAESRTSAPTATVEYGAPTALSVTVGVGQVVLVWRRPVAGGLAFSGYEYRYSAGGMILPTAMWQPVQSPGSIRPEQAYFQQVKGLTSGTTYTFQVRTAANAVKGAPATVTATPVSQPSCTIDELGDRRLLWQGQLTAGILAVATDGNIETGYGTGGTETGTLTPDAVTFRSTTYSALPRRHPTIISTLSYANQTLPGTQEKRWSTH